jgi:hypothetical protein
MLYSRAIYAAEKQVDSTELNRLINTIAKLENTRSNGFHRARNPHGPTNNPPATRHRVELTVSPGNPKNVAITAERLPNPADRP